jgi:hypothetical protein
MATDRREYYREYNRKRMEDPERYAKQKKRVVESTRRRKIRDPEFAEMCRIKSLDYYYAKKALLLKEQCAEDNCFQA